MFTSYNNEQNQRGGMDDSNIMRINAGYDLDPKRGMLNVLSPEQVNDARTAAAAAAPAAAAAAAAAPPAAALVPDTVVDSCNLFPVNFVMDDNSNIYEIDEKGFVNKSKKHNISVNLKRGSNDDNDNDIDIRELVDNCIKGVNTEKCKKSLTIVGELVNTMKDELKKQNKEMFLYLADILINKYKFKKKIDATTIRSDPKPPTYILQSVEEWLVDTIPEEFRKSIKGNNELIELLSCIVEGINFNETFLNPHKVPKNESQFRDRPYQGPNSWLWTPTQPIDYKERCYKLVKRCENLFTADLNSFRVAVTGLLIPFNSNYYGGGFDQIGGTSIVNKDKLINQLKDAGPWFRQLFAEFKQSLGKDGKTFDSGDEGNFNRLVGQYETARKSLIKHVGIMLNAMNENTGNAKTVNFNSLNRITSQNIQKRLDDCAKSQNVIFDVFGRIIGHM
jgi:hypothetical protein